MRWKVTDKTPTGDKLYKWRTEISVIDKSLQEKSVVNGAELIWKTLNRIREKTMCRMLITGNRDIRTLPTDLNVEERCAEHELNHVMPG